MRYRIHVIQVSTTQKDLFLYSHYADRDHDPCLTLSFQSGITCMECEDLFKFKPNVQALPKDRVDIYIPYETAILLGTEISNHIGNGAFFEERGADPERFRQGKQTLPIIGDSRLLRYRTAEVQIAGRALSQSAKRFFVDQESPNDSHIEMKGPEIHFGVDMSGCVHSGKIDFDRIERVNIPKSELRIAGEANPVRKSFGRVRITFDNENAKRLGVILKSFNSP